MDIDFYFDFTSPYSYFAAHQVDALAEKHGCQVAWRPFLLGVAMQVTGQGVLVEQPLKGDYSLLDMKRMARHMGLPFAMPDPFPVRSLASSRAFYWLLEQDAGLARQMALANFKACFGDGENTALPETVVRIAAGLGVDPDACLAAMDDQANKDRLRDETENAIKRGVFGAPFFFIGDEPFWGNDRLEWMD
ncbi:MAG: 2-hydroxychromene-2-carboxylate isomerase, partial [Rhodospirillales bacterium]|nr:2-hydroxychromene-2-carboxylate isomerase [Rhodospirillales bacterium]